MPLSLKIESKTFDQAIADLARMTGRSVSDIIKAEARSILGVAMQKTDPADKKLIRARYTYKGEGDQAPSVVTPFARIDGKKYRVRSILKKGVWAYPPQKNLGQNVKKKFYKNRINPLYKKLQASLKKTMNYALSQHGQSKATFIYLGEKLKLKDTSKEKKKMGGVIIPAYVKKAYKNLPDKLKRRLRANGFGDKKFYIEISHKGESALSKDARGMSAFASAFQGRKNYYRTNVALGVFESTKKVLQRYPSLKVTKD